VGHSTPLRNFFLKKNASLTAINDDNYKVDVVDGKLAVSLKDSETGGVFTDTSLVLVDTSTIRITIYTDRFRNDANYVRTAIKSIKRFSNRKIRLAITNNYTDIAANQDWLFWLSEQNIPPAIRAVNIIKYERGKIENKTSRISTGDGVSNNQQQIGITKNVQSQQSKNFSETIWSDGFGSHLLDKEAGLNTSVYHFYSHFDPEWNELVWSEQFPGLIFKLIFNEEDYIAGVYDKRLIAEKQLQPVILPKSESVVKEKFIKKIDFSYYFWLAAFILFFIERVLSFRNKKEVIYD
jgi:hypothetical protein